MNKKLKKNIFVDSTNDRQMSKEISNLVSVPHVVDNNLRFGPNFYCIKVIYLFIINNAFLIKIKVFKVRLFFFIHL